MKKIYIVASGEYEEYHIDKVFLDHELAKEYCKSRMEDCEIEEWNISESIQKLNYYIETYRYDGKIKSRIMYEEDYDFFEKYRSCGVSTMFTLSIYTEIDNIDNLNTYKDSLDNTILVDNDYYKDLYRKIEKLHVDNDSREYLTEKLKNIHKR